ncbi:Dicer-like protein 2 [Sporothrix bragantina]|uniref:Dicer-like protein 2 n=1 Tax=Sporothrix bragantina TaxID=671064 RepID=A0ABP0BCZ2_9PEZI
MASPTAMEIGSSEASDPLLAESRSYQLEMFQESMRRNVIVAMDTGTGKTRIAILRIRAELERSPAPKIVWFLAPSVFLCYQQFYAISSQISCVQGRLIAGEADIKTWSTQAVWDAALLNIRFVVATHDVLLEALKHGFVRMDSIPLLVFDEVHGCVRNHPGRLIMEDFYKPAVEYGEPHPHILGLTASPVQGTKLEGVEELERTMHATCITPTQYRHDLVTHTKRPLTLRHINSRSGASQVSPPGSDNNLASLYRLHEALSFSQPWPEVDQITKQYTSLIGTDDVQWINDFIKRFSIKATAIFLHLGSWPAEFYVYKIIRQCKMTTSKHPLKKDEPYLLALIQQLDIRRPVCPGHDKDDAPFYNGLSPQVQKLIEILADHEAERPTGIVFVKEQPMAAVLAKIISIHPRIKSRYATGHVVGMSKSQQNGYLEGLLTMAPRDGRVPLLDFRNRKLNLLVATSVIEEGIDIPDCNFVVCVDNVTNLKSFIQRRGRARDKNSEFHLLMYEAPSNGPVSPFRTANSKKQMREWEVLEAEMKQRYENEQREDEKLQREEAKSALGDGRLQPLCVKSTGARLTARDAKGHLSHFCATMSSAAFVDTRPVFTLYNDATSGQRYRASVHLPMSLPQHLRRAESEFAWQSQADAEADAAFQAYRALYDAGLLTDNLLPPRPSQDQVSRFVESRRGFAAVHEPYRPWPAISQMWEALVHNSAGPEASVFSHSIRISNDQDHELFYAQLVLPCPLPNIKPFQLFWTAHALRSWTVHISAAQRQIYGYGDGQYHDDQDHAGALLNAAFGHRWPLGDMHRLVRVVFPDEHFGKEHIGSRAFDPQIFANMTRPFSSDSACLVRDADGVPYFYEGFLESKPPLNSVRKIYEGFVEVPEDTAHVVLRPWPKIAGMLYTSAKPATGEDTDEKHRNEDSSDGTPNPHASSAKPYPRVLPAAQCRVDDLPVAYVQFGAILPSLTSVLEVSLVASELLSTTRLGQLPIRDVSLVATAISATAARLPTNYEHLEFIGDSLLKVLATVNCAAQNPDLPEGQLSLYKDRLVTNSRLFRAALEVGLDRFIVTKQWSLRQWKRYCDALGESRSLNASKCATAITGAMPGEVDTPENSKKPALEMSTKTLADVVEALIGACYVDSGMAQALQCISLFIPDAKWLSIDDCRKMLFEEAPNKAAREPPPGLEELIGYTFTKKSLLIEAITHASLPSNQEGACMERIEFIGDAILDHIIVQTLACVRPELPHQKMHLLRTTLVNYAFLAFTTMMLTIAEPAVTVIPQDVQSGAVDPVLPVSRAPPFLKSLSSFMRHGASRELGVRQELFAERFISRKQTILEQLWTGKKYPWVLLLGLGADKFHSDILEAVIGAVWVDSGSMAAVEALLEKVGILPYLRRAVEEDVHLMHPKEELGKVTGNATISYEVSSLTRAEALKLDVSQVSKMSLVDNQNEYGKDPSMVNDVEASNETFKGDNNSDDTDEEDDGAISDTDPDHEAKIRRRAIVGDVMDDVGYRCRLIFNGKCEFEVGFCNTKEEAEAAVADMALDAWWQGKLRNGK